MKHLFRKLRGFTLIELLVVIAIITVLAGLTISTIGGAQLRAGRDRAKVEINGLSLALESYKIDNGDYPRSSDYPTLIDQAADSLDAVAQVAKCTPGPNVDALTSTGTYMLASMAMYKALSGDGIDGSTTDRSISTAEKALGRVYFPFKPGMLYPQRPAGSTEPVQAVIDPFKNVYGYSTLGSVTLTGTATQGGYNPTFDLWSTADREQKGTPSAAWITNW